MHHIGLAIRVERVAKMFHGLIEIGIDNLEGLAQRRFKGLKEFRVLIVATLLNSLKGLR